MEPTEVWSSFNAALNELGTLCCDEGRLDERKKLDYPHPQVDKCVSSKLSKCQDRHLLPSQFWNRSDTLSGINKAEVDGGTSKRKVKTSHGEDSENAFYVKTSKAIRSVESKDSVPPCTIVSSYTLCDFNDLPRIDRFRVVRMNNRYINNLSVGKVRSLPRKTQTNSRGGNSQSTTKQGHIRPHHLRPYEIPKRREKRIRTLSENEHEISRVANLDLPGDDNNNTGSSRLLRSRSLENVRISDDIKQVPVLEMESMYNRIQHLQMYD